MQRTRLGPASLASTLTATPRICSPLLHALAAEEHIKPLLCARNRMQAPLLHALQAPPPRVVVQPPHEVELADVGASLRNHFDGSQHDAYLRQDPDERYRPIAVLRSGNGHISQLRRAGAVPDALSVINWVAWASESPA
jgi:hypothetical protein